MQTVPAWAKALQIPKASLDEWLTVAPVEESFTFWCLFSGRLPLESYFAWAVDHYGLALLQSDYFKQTPNHELWKQIQTVANWSPWMLPIEQWDGVVFIACVEPPTDMQWSFPVAFVLAEPNQLEQHWQKLISHSDIAATTPAAAPSTAPAAAAPSDSTAATPPPVPLNLAPATPPPPPIKPEDMPLGLKENAAPQNDGSPLGLNLSDLKIEGLNPPPPTPTVEKLDLNALDSPVPLKMPPTEKSPFGIKLDIPEAAASPTPTIAPPAPATAKAAAVTPKQLPANIPAGPVNASQAPAQLEAATTDEACLAWLFKQIRSRYSPGLVLLYNKNSLQAWKWDSGLQPKSAEARITFDTPSLFRIAARTMRSYHGYVVENPVHQEFFQNWGFSKPPVHVTGIPIVSNGQFHGLFLCSANEPLGADALEFLEMTVGKTIMQMEKIDGLIASLKAA